jgi:ribulose-phosphate 3-epimerase
MRKPFQIVPSILAADFTRLGQHIQEAEAGGADMFHIDVMDGRFVPNISMGALIVEAVRRVTKLPLDVHLMIVEPERHLDAFAQAGADRITVHIEASPHLHRTLTTIRSLGCKAGVALNPHTPASAIAEVMKLLDQVLVMTVNPGYGGQQFLQEMLPKVTHVQTMIADSNREIDLEVDGGINIQTASTVAQAGANILIVGTDIFDDGQPIAQNINSLRSSISE